MSTQSLNEAFVNDLLSELLAERARGDRLADRAVMLESRLARVTDLLRWGIEHERVCGRGQDLLGNFYDALAVAEGES
jgi:hypothetical protein